ncbi:MAG: restriction endonuclease subunit S, partial [Candidatus Omnitrophota bacterium]
MKLTEYKIKEFAKIEAGGTPDTKNPSYWEGDISWITPNDLTSYEKMYISKGERNITTEGLRNSSAKLLPPKTVLLTTRAPVGHVALAGAEVSTNQGFKNLICDLTKADPEFVYYLLKKNKTLLQAHATGSTFVELSGSRISNIKLNLPDLNIQKKIALILISYDNLIDTNRQQIQLLEETARLLYREWFVYFRFPGHEKVKIADGMPGGWERQPIATIADCVGGGTPSTSVPAYWENGDITWVT